MQNNGGGDAKDRFIDAIIPDLPLIMHGSGDVTPSQVDMGTTSLLAELTATYVYDLVQAAVDSHDILTDGAGGLLPPPPPNFCDVTNDNSTKKKRQRKTEEKEPEDNWEGPLPIPKIFKTNAGALMGGTKRQFVSKAIYEDSRIKDVPQSYESSLSWKGAKGINLFPNRIRNHYAATPTTIGPQCFIYPISHDAQLDNRVKTLLTEQKEFSDVMLNQAVVKYAKEDCDSILGNAVFGWVGLGLDAGKDADRRKDAIGGVTDDGIHAESSNANEGGSTESDENRRSLAKSLGLEIQWPALEDLCKPDHNEPYA